ncbi:MAG: guanine deaminase [Nitrosomonas sp.]|nr:guanine deaminase [Nitrosomonas sp.]
MLNSSSTSSMARAIRGSLFFFLDDPGADHNPVGSYQYFEDGILVLTDDGHIADIGSATNMQSRYGLANRDIIDHSGKLIVPGFIDTHTHYPQSEIIAAYGHQLIQWLDKYAFPAEAKFYDKHYARTISRFFLSELLRNGTTTALIFGSVHKVSAEALFEEAEKLNMRIIGGKIMMDRNAPQHLLDTPETAYSDSKALIETWHNKRGRISYAVTPRFAATSSSEQLQAAQRLYHAYDDMYLQTHVSENQHEIAWIKQLFPSSKSYLNVYNDFGLVGPRSIFAHGIHLTDDEFKLLADKNAAIAFCPTSNLFLGSGLFNFDQACLINVRLTLGTDIGAGTSFSLLKTMAEAYKVVQLQSNSASASKKKTPLTPFKTFYMATLGAARALYLEDKIGTLQPGKEGDFIVLNPDATPLLNFRMRKTLSLADRLFTLMMLADDRAIDAVYLMGKRWQNSEAYS